MNSYWVIMSYEIEEPDLSWQRYYWVCGLACESMRAAFIRLASEKGIVDMKHDETHWEGHHEPNRFGNRTEYEVLAQEEMPETSIYERVTIYDHRETDRNRKRVIEETYAKEIPREGLKKMPAAFSFVPK